MSKKLLVNDGRRERELVLMQRIVVGRDPTCDVSHDDALLSRRHAEFEASGDQVTVRDLGSRNGIFVNGFRAAEQSLRPGDVVQIGPLKVRYAHDDAPVSILPEQLITDATIVMAPSAATPMPPPPRPVAIEIDSGERTQIFAPPLASEAARSYTPRPASPSDDPMPDDDATQFIPPPRPPAESGTRVKPVPPRSAPEPAVRSITPRPSVAVSAARPSPAVIREPARTLPDPAVRTFVFVQLFALAGMVFLAAVVPLLIWRGGVVDGSTQSAAAAPLAWLALPLGVAIVGAYLVGNVINRRIVDALRAATGTAPGLPRA